MIARPEKGASEGDKLQFKGGGERKRGLEDRPGKEAQVICLI